VHVIDLTAVRHSSGLLSRGVATVVLTASSSRSPHLVVERLTVVDEARVNG
jgi:uncharacterized protein YwbE